MLKCITSPPFLFPLCPSRILEFSHNYKHPGKNCLPFLVICFLHKNITPPRTCMFHSSKAWHVACKFDIFLINTLKILRNKLRIWLEATVTGQCDEYFREVSEGNHLRVCEMRACLKFMLANPLGHGQMLIVL